MKPVVTGDYIRYGGGKLPSNVSRLY